MTDPVHPAVLEPVYDKLFGARQRMSSLPVLCQEVASNGPAWLPLVLVLGAIGAVAYADHRVVVPSLIYLYILPLTVGAILLPQGNQLRDELLKDVELAAEVQRLFLPSDLPFPGCK
jgi:hypothetical protein